MRAVSPARCARRIAMVAVLSAGAAACSVPGTPPVAAIHLVGTLPPVESGEPDPSPATAVTPADGAFAGPHFRFQFVAVRVGDTGPKAGSRTSDTARQHAAAGYQLVAAYTKPPGQPGWRALDSDSVTGQVVVDGTPRPLPADALTKGSGLVVSVPKGRPVILRVTDDGRTQSYDLRAGRRGDDAVAGYYRPQQVTGLDKLTYDGAAICPPVSVPYLGDLDCGAHITLDSTVGVSSASLNPWVPVYGWAAPGRTWLVLSSLLLTVDPVITIAPGGASLTLLDEKSYSMILPGGTTVAAHAAAQDPRFTQETAVAFDLPDGFVTGTLAVHPDGNLTVGGRPGHWTTPAPTVQVTLTLTP